MKGEALEAAVSQHTGFTNVANVANVRMFELIVLRYSRLTASLAFAMLVNYKIWPYFAHGPFAQRFQQLSAVKV